MEHQCEQKFETEQCPNEAKARMFWPGNEPLYICDRCAAGAKNIANAMGFYLHFEEIK